MTWALASAGMPEEFAATGASMARRGPRTAEYVAVLRHLWTQDTSEFSGEFYSVPRGRMAPRPVQQDGPPVLLGGMARPALERIGRIADGWLTSSRTDLSKIGEGIGVVREAAAAAGRDPAALRVICRGVVRAGAEVQAADGSGRLLLSAALTRSARTLRGFQNGASRRFSMTSTGIPRWRAGHRSGGGGRQGERTARRASARLARGQRVMADSGSPSSGSTATPLRIGTPSAARTMATGLPSSWRIRTL